MAATVRLISRNGGSVVGNYADLLFFHGTRQKQRGVRRQAQG